MKRALRLISAGLAIASMWLLPASVALGWVHHGCEYDSAQPPSITFHYFSVGSTYQGAVNWAKNEWNDHTGSTTYFVWTSSSDPNIDVYDGSYSWDAWAKVQWSCWPTTHTYVGDEVQMYLNTRTMGGLNSTEKMFVASHELGHTYGLGDSSWGCASPGPAVMKQGESKFSCAGLPPWTDDLNGWNAVGY